MGKQAPEPQVSKLILDGPTQRRIMALRRARMAQKTRELKAQPRYQRWMSLTQDERAKEVIELMVKNHMEHARMLGRFGDETKLRNALAKLAISHDIFHDNERFRMKEHVY